MNWSRRLSFNKQTAGEVKRENEDEIVNDAMSLLTEF